MSLDQTQYANAMSQDPLSGKPMQKVATMADENRVKYKIYGSANVTQALATTCTGFEIANDGTANLTYTINGMSFDVKAGEIDSARFDPFTSVTIAATGAFRARVFG